MKSTFVLATAESRLHADIMMIRLRRAGISIDRISAVFSRRFAPNSCFFWLRNPRTLRCRTKGESFFVAGPLEQLFGRGEVEAVPTILRHLGLSRRESVHFGHSLWLGHGVLCVEVKDQDQAAIAWHIFKHSRAEDITVSGVAVAKREVEPLEIPMLPAFAA